MIGIDTNVLVRLLTRDDEHQYKKACLLFERPLVYISDTVFLETEWVLRYSYQYEAAEINDALKAVLGLPNVKTSNVESLKTALRCHREGMDFADALHCSGAASCHSFYTFDRRFVKKAKVSSLKADVVLVV